MFYCIRHILFVTESLCLLLRETMDSILIIIAISLAIASVINIVLSKFAISHIVGYIITGTVISNMFDFNGHADLHSLDLIGEFGIVFLMFTIGLEFSISHLNYVFTHFNLSINFKLMLNY